MEIGLGVLEKEWCQSLVDLLNSLNPCFSGNRFGRQQDRPVGKTNRVLILVLVEIGLGVLQA